MADTVGKVNPFLYRGYCYDPETGLYYLNSRYYDPETGRFLNADGQLTPGSGLDGMNLFVYGVNNPVNLTDSTGHFPFLAITGAIGVVVGGIVGGVIAAKRGKNVWAGIGIGVAAGGLIGLGLGAAAGALLAGSATASTAAVITGAGTLVNQAGNTIGQAVAKVANKVSLATQRVVRYVSNTSVKASSSRLSVKKS